MKFIKEKVEKRSVIFLTIFSALFISALTGYLFFDLYVGPRVGKPVEFETLVKGSVSEHMRCKGYIINSNEEFREVWIEHVGGFIVSQILPDIDFDKSTVIAFFSGNRASAGFSVEITEVIFSFVRVYARIEETSPGFREPIGIDSSQPYHMVEIPKTRKSVRFFDRSFLRRLACVTSNITHRMR